MFSLFVSVCWCSNSHKNLTHSVMVLNHVTHPLSNLIFTSIIFILTYSFCLFHCCRVTDPSDHPFVFSPASGHDAGPLSSAVHSRPPLPTAPRPSPRRSRHSFSSPPFQSETQVSPSPSPQPSPRSKHRKLTHSLLSGPSALPNPPSNQDTVQSASSTLPPSDGPPSPVTNPSHTILTSPSPSTAPHKSCLAPLTHKPIPTTPLSFSHPKPTLSSEPSSTHPPLTRTPSQPPSLPRIFQTGSVKGINMG